jgi:signal transduction histidine kinase
MRLRVPHALVRRSWWWVFSLCIATPAVALAVLGVGALRADDLERENRRRDREAQLVGLVDTALANVLEHLATDTGAAPGERLADSIRFELEGDGRLLFPDDCLVEGDDSGPPPEARVGLPRNLAGQVADAQAADAQGRAAEATALYEQLRRHAALRPWVDVQTTLMGIDVIDESVALRISQIGYARADALSPSGIPLAIVAAGLTDAMTPKGHEAFVPFLSDTRAQLQAGRWWLSLAQRRAYGEELDRWLAEADRAAGGRPDVRLEAVARVVPLIRRAITETPGPSDRAQLIGPDASRVLIVWSRPVQPSAVWRGVVVPGASAEAAFSATFGPLIRDEPARLAIRDGAATVWGAETAPDATPYPLEAVPGWSLVVTDTTPPVPVERRVLQYGRVVLPILVLAFGLLMTVWIVRREIALTSLQSAFVAAVTHEFKSPITSIRLLLERITSGRMAPGDAPDRYFAAIGAETDRLERLVNRLLEARKLQDGQRDYRFHPEAIEVLVRDAVARLRPQADAKGMTMTVTTVPDLPPVDLDAESMSDAIANLIDNAIKYSPDGSRVGVSVDREADRIRVVVTDDGIGVQPADAGRIFDPFFRSRRGDRANVHGTGLGLSLVKATVEAHGGTVAVESDGVRGSRFVFTVPMATRAPQVELNASPDAAGTIGPAAGTS